MQKIPQKVFIDANVVIQAGKPPGGPLILRLADLVKAEMIKVLTTDLTVNEVAKKHIENEYSVIKEVGRRHFREILNEHVGCALPEVSKAELRASISKKYVKSVAAMFENLKAKTLKIDDVIPSIVFTEYSEGKGFFSGEGKKDQFPDAFIFECLKAEASAESNIIIVSDDSDFNAPVNSTENISLLKTIPDLFQKLGLRVEAPEIEGFLDENKDELLRFVDRELNNWSLQVADVEDAVIDEITVTSIEPKDIISFGSSEEEEGSILIVGSLEITMDISYTHPDWATAIYDSEDKVTIPFREVSGETEVTLDADFSMSILVDDKEKPVQIENFSFRNDKFIFVDIYPYERYD